MSMEWLGKDLWRSHVAWLTPTWVGATEEKRTDFDATRWLDQIQSAHYRTLIFYTKHHDGYCTFPSKYSKLQPDRDFFGECAAEAHKRDMRILAYYSSVLDQITGNEHPAWRVTGRDGKPADGWFNRFWPGAYCCINNPGYRDLVLGQLAELRDNYMPDGFWLDVFSPHSGENCFCRYCRDKYRKETGGDLLETKGELWYDTCFADLMREINALVKKDNPDCVLGQNTGTRIPDVEKHVDFLTHEAVDAPTISMMCRSMRSLGKPIETTYRLYSTVISWTLKGPNRVLLEAATCMAHGCACCLELCPTPAGKILDAPVNRLSELGRYIREAEPYLIDTEPIYDAAVFQPETLFGWTWAPTLGWAPVLVERDIPYGIIYRDADFSPYRLLILDGNSTMDDKLAERLKHYVGQGGNLIVECDAVRFGTPAGDICSEVLGITSQGKTGFPAHYLSVMDRRLAENMGEDDLIVEGDAYRIGMTTAKPLAYFRHEYTNRPKAVGILGCLPPKATRSGDVAITVNKYGRGRAMYIACPLGENEILGHKNKKNDAREYPVQLGENLVRFMIRNPLLRGTTPAGVEVIVNAQKGRHVVHLLNQYAAGQYNDNRPGLLKLADITLSINERRIGHVKRAFQVAGRKKEKLTVQHNGPWVEVKLPELGVHGLIVLEH